MEIGIVPKASLVQIGISSHFKPLNFRKQLSITLLEVRLSLAQNGILFSKTRIQDYIQTLNPEKCEKPSSVGNVDLLCQHKMFKYPIHLMEGLRNIRKRVSSFTFEDSKVCKWLLVKQEEWAFIQDLFSVDFDIKITVAANIGHDCDYVYFPGMIQVTLM
ncbi:unnamed protein product [Allacma fusca]|uniref:Uncharacterized protein n=1 Tax=Allacma fusca TaxID=39272 RepID=A0A8J2MD79_9HEXA|nr:unnamed protein product [Allacma fusca]